MLDRVNLQLDTIDRSGRVSPRLQLIRERIHTPVLGADKDTAATKIYMRCCLCRQPIAVIAPSGRYPNAYRFIRYVRNSGNCPRTEDGNHYFMGAGRNSHA
jgi:hypothetical protein